MVRTVEKVTARDRMLDAAFDDMRAYSPRLCPIVQKQLTVDEESRSATMLISREVVDRDREMVRLRGIDLEGFRKNPVVLFLHDPAALIGKAASVKVRRRDGRNEMIGKVIFAETELAEEVFQLVKGDFIRGASLALNNRTLKIRAVTPGDVRKQPELADADRIIEEGELIEFSIVTIPANQDALASAVSKGIVNHTRPFLEPILRRIRLVQKAARFVERVAPEEAARTVERVGTPEADPEKLVRRAIAYRAGRI